MAIFKRTGARPPQDPPRDPGTAVAPPVPPVPAEGPAPENDHRALYERLAPLYERLLRQASAMNTQAERDAGRIAELEKANTGLEATLAQTQARIENACPGKAEMGTTKDGRGYVTVVSNDGRTRTLYPSTATSRTYELTFEQLVERALRPGLETAVQEAIRMTRESEKGLRAENFTFEYTFEVGYDGSRLGTLDTRLRVTHEALGDSGGLVDVPPQVIQARGIGYRVLQISGSREHLLVEHLVAERHLNPALDAASSAVMRLAEDLRSDEPTLYRGIMPRDQKFKIDIKYADNVTPQEGVVFDWSVHTDGQEPRGQYGESGPQAPPTAHNGGGPGSLESRAGSAGSGVAATNGFDPAVLEAARNLTARQYHDVLRSGDLNLAVAYVYVRPDSTRDSTAVETSVALFTGLDRVGEEGIRRRVALMGMFRSTTPDFHRVLIEKPAYAKFVPYT